LKNADLSTRLRNSDLNSVQLSGFSHPVHSVARLHLKQFGIFLPIPKLKPFIKISCLSWKARTRNTSEVKLRIPTCRVNEVYLLKNYVLVYPVGRRACSL
jgi:hypothetical protein